MKKKPNSGNVSVASDLVIYFPRPKSNGDDSIETTPKDGDSYQTPMANLNTTTQHDRSSDLADLPAVEILPRKCRPMIYFGLKTSWKSISDIFPHVCISLWGVQVGPFWVGVIVRRKDESTEGP